MRRARVSFRMKALPAGPLLWIGPMIGVLCSIMFLTARLGHGAGRVAGGRGQIDLSDDRYDFDERPEWATHSGHALTAQVHGSLAAPL